MTPLEALDGAILCAFVSSTVRSRPGEVIRKMKPEARAALERLTSADLGTLRPDVCVPPVARVNP